MRRRVVSLRASAHKPNFRFGAEVADDGNRPEADLHIKKERVLVGNAVLSRLSMMSFMERGKDTAYQSVNALLLRASYDTGRGLVAFSPVLTRFDCYVRQGAAPAYGGNRPKSACHVSAEHDSIAAGTGLVENAWT